MNYFSRIILKILRNSSASPFINHGSASVGKDFKTGNFCEFSVYPSAKRITVGSNVVFRNSCNILVGGGAELALGDSFFMNNFCSINCLEKIEIGENTLFGEGVKVYDHNHEFSADKVEHRKFKTAPIKIGRNCWLGSNVTVLKGVTIGDNTIIGANC